MKISEYERKASQTAVYPDRGSNLLYTALGLCEEAGEFAGHLKKAMRDSGGVLSPEVRTKMLAELGDVLWYVAAAAYELDADLESVAQANIDKLADRQRRGKLGGYGDDR